MVAEKSEKEIKHDAEEHVIVTMFHGRPRESVSRARTVTKQN